MKTEIVEWFKNNYNLYYELMQESSHTHSNGSLNPFHLEGSVWTHTMMVLDLVPDDINLIFAAILHDLGKPYSRVEKVSGRVAFLNHENISMYKSIDILLEAKKKYDIDILLILQLIAWHGTLWNKTPIESKIKTLDLCYGHQPELLTSLISFVEADAYGREFSKNVQDDVNFIDDQFKFLYNYIPYNKLEFQDKKDLEVIMLIGVSGSGKSTWLSKKDLSNYSIISVDSYFDKKKMNYDSIDYNKNIDKAFQQSLVDLDHAVKTKKNIIIDMTNLTKEFRRKKLSKIPQNQYTSKAIVFLNGEKSINENLRKREGKRLSKDIIEKQISQFELPNYDEFDVIEFKI